MDVGCHFFHERFIAGEIVVVHEHLKPADGIARVEVVVVFVLEQPRKLPHVLPRQPRLGEGVMVHHGLNQVIAWITDRFLMIRRIEMMRLQANLHCPARHLPDPVQLLVAALERAAILHRL